MIEHVKVSAPLTLNMAGVGDIIPVLSLRGQRKYYTVTASLDSRIELEMQRNGTDTMRIEYCVQDNPPIIWTGKEEEYDFTDPWGILLVAWAHHDLTGIDAIIRVPFETPWGLGELEALGLCAIRGCTELLGKRLEDGNRFIAVACELLGIIQPYIHISNIFSSLRGGIRFWDWKQSLLSSQSIRVMSSDNFSELQERIVIAAPTTPVPSKSPRAFANGCLKSGVIAELSRMNELIPDAVNSVRIGDWIPFLDHVRGEREVVNDIDTQRGVGFESLQNAPGITRGSFSVLGYGQRGCWFLSDKKEDVDNVKDEWSTRGAIILEVKFSDVGLL